MSQASLKDAIALAALWCDYFGLPQLFTAVAESYQHTDQSDDRGKVVSFVPAHVKATDHSIVLASDLEPPNGSGRHLGDFAWNGGATDAAWKGHARAVHSSGPDG